MSLRDQYPEDRLVADLVEMTAREATEARIRVGRLTGSHLPVSAYERRLYVSEGLEPPTDFTGGLSAVDYIKEMRNQ